MRLLALVPLAGALIVACGGGAASFQQRGSTAPGAKVPDPSSLEARIDALVRTEALDRGVPGVAVVIVQRGQVLLAQGYGVADVTTGRKVTAATPFNIASVTKLFTAAVVQKLAQESRVELDAPVSRYLQMPAVYEQLTIRQLLTHTSGIARDLRRDNDDDPDGAEYQRRLMESQRSGAPGARFEYSNTGHTVLGWLIETVERRPLEQVFRERLFDPLGMDQARYRAAIEDDVQRARPHEVREGVTRPATYITGGHGSGGLSLSAADFAAFAVGLQQGRHLTAAQLQEAWTPGQLADGTIAPVRLNNDNDGYGFGWFITTFEGHRLLTHGGGITGYSANLYHFPDEQLTIVVLANVKARNDGAAPVDPLARQIAKICLVQRAVRD